MPSLSKDHRSHRGLARILGYDHLAAMVLSKIWAWAKVAKKKEFGVTKTDEEWCRDLEVTPKQFRRTKELLVDLRLIEKTRSPWGRRANALFLKPTPLAERILATPPFWAPSSRPKGHVVVNIGPNGQKEYPLYSPNGPFLYPIKTNSKKNEFKGETVFSDQAHAWSQMPPEELSNLVIQEELGELREIEIETIPRLIAHWEYQYCQALDTEVSPPWLPGHLEIVDRLIDEQVEENLVSAIKSDLEDEAWAKEQGEDEDGSVEKYVLEEKRVSDPDTFRAETREDVEPEICRQLAITISWTVPHWHHFTDWLKKVVDTKDVPETPEVEFLLYYSSLAEVWAKEHHFSNHSDDDHLKDGLYLSKANLDRGEAEFHEVAGKHHPDYQKVPWTFDQRVAVYLGAGVQIAIMAARHWTKWRGIQGDKDDIKPLSTDAMIEELDDIATWAVELWNPEGGIKIGDGDDDVSIWLPSPSKDNDYWPVDPEKLDGQEVVSNNQP